MKQKKLKIILPIIVMAVCMSCKSNRDVAYLQDMLIERNYQIEEKREIILQKNDLLNIKIECSEPELLLPFKDSQNLGINKQPVSEYVSHKSNAGITCRIDTHGNIIFPVLGKIQLEGLYLPQAQDLISSMLVTNEIIPDPIVNIELLNFKYTVLGAVASNGQYVVDGYQINILEAIARAGDITSRGNAGKVFVIRTIDGKTTRTVLNLKSSDIFNSAYFYLQPNDIVYVEPRYRSQDRKSNVLQYASFLISLTSVILTAIWILD